MFCGRGDPFRERRKGHAPVATMDGADIDVSLSDTVVVVVIAHVLLYPTTGRVMARFIHMQPPFHVGAGDWAGIIVLLDPLSIHVLYHPTHGTDVALVARSVKETACPANAKVLDAQKLGARTEREAITQ